MCPGVGQSMWGVRSSPHDSGHVRPVWRCRSQCAHGFPAWLARMLLLFSGRKLTGFRGCRRGAVAYVETKADMKVEGGDMGFTHTRAMTTLVVATFAVLILTGCSGGESESGKAPWRGNTADGPARVPTISVLPPGSLAPGMEMKELPEFPESSGMSDERAEQAVDTMVTGDVGAVERLSLQQYMGAPDGRTNSHSDQVLENLRR